MADPGFMKLTIEDSDIAVLTLDDPRGSANVLSRAVLDELEQASDRRWKAARTWPGW